MFTAHRHCGLMKYGQGFLLLAIVFSLLGMAPAIAQAKSLAQPDATQQDIPLPPPQLTAPIDRSNQSSLTPKLSWSAVSGAKLYFLQVSPIADFSSQTNEQFLTSPSKIMDVDALKYGVTYYWKVAACVDASACNTSLHGPFSAVRRFTPTIQISPADGAYTTNQSVTFSWANVPGATNYAFFLSTLPNIDFSSGPVQTGLGTKFTATSSSPYRVWYWGVCVTLIGKQPECPSSTWRVTVTQPLPPAPILVSPASNSSSASHSPAFTWSPINVNLTPGGPFTYQLQVDTLSTFTHPLLEEKGNMLIAAPTVPDGVLYWRVRAINQLGAAGKWSLAWKITVDTSEPAPVLLNPTDHATTTSTRPTFKWSKPSSASKTYRLTVHPTSYIAADLVFPLLRSTSYTPAVNSPLPAGSYTWWVTATDSLYNASTNDVSTGFHLTITAPNSNPDIPAAPALLSPVDKGMLILGATPTFTWQFPGNSTTLSSEIQFSSSASFQSSFGQTTAAGVSWASPNAGFIGPYYWRVRVYNSSYSSPWSKVRSFRGQTTWPPTILAPAMNANLSQHRPVLSWTAVPGAVNYTVNIYQNGKPQAVQSATVSKTSYTPTADLDFGQVAWNLTANDAFGQQTVLQTSQFFIPLQFSPAAGAVTADPTKVTLKWSAYPGATSYTLKIYNTANIGNTPVVTKTQSTTSYTLSSADAQSLPQGIYYWTVEESPITPAPLAPNYYELYVTQAVPAAPVLQTPANKVIAGPLLLPQFSWTNKMFSATYDLEVSKTAAFSGQPGMTVMTSNIPYIITLNNTSSATLTIAGFPAPTTQNCTYYWRVRGINLGVDGPWGSVRSIVWYGQKPNVPTPLSEANQRWSTNSQLSLAWSAVPGAAGYDVIFTSGLLPDPNNNPYPPPTRLGKVTSYKLPTTISDGVVYLWAVRSYDPAGNLSPWTPVQAMNILAGLSVPKTPTPTAPAETITVEPDMTATPLPTDPTVEPSLTPTPAATDPTIEAPAATATPVATGVDTAAAPEPTATPAP